MDSLPNNKFANPEVLLVDDVPMLLRSVGRLLEMEYEVAYATSGREALDILAQFPKIKVIISDYSMEGMSGIQLFKHTAEDFPNASRILLTGVPQLDIARDAIQETRLHRFLCKPCGAKELMNAVASGVESYAESLRQELETGHLLFSNKSLFDLNRNLEERVVDQSHSIQCLRRLGIALNKDQGLDGIARVAAGAACQALENRGVYVQLSDLSGSFAEGSAGPEMGMRMVSEPLTTKDGTIGEIVVDVMNSAGREITSAQQNILAAIASTTSVAAHNEFRRKERDEAQYATVFALARLSESRDRVIGSHLERVSEYCRRIAESMLARGAYPATLDRAFIEDLVMSAPLHDIGKVGIPDAILRKKGRLNATEWEVMKTHVDIGAETLRSVIGHSQTQSYLVMGLDLALHHHERWDGSGYPKGLVGEEISLSSRILALADVYDALTSVRPHKGAWGHDEAMALLEEERGKHFDPIVVDAFLAIGEEIRQLSHELENGSSSTTPILGPIKRIA